jgi:predicted nuclease with RNAse H fold
MVAWCRCRQDADLAVGVDVAEERKGMDLVALDSQRRITASYGKLSVAAVAELVVDELRPSIVCVDSPPAFSRSGVTRQAERELARAGFPAFPVGSDPGDHPFFRWMRVGFRVFEAVAEAYPLYRSGDPRGCATEVFPNAAAVVILGQRRHCEETKTSFRRRALAAAGVAQERLANLDRVDAGLAALSGLYALEGRFVALGDPDEGVVVVPKPFEGPLSPYPLERGQLPRVPSE